MMIFGVNFWFYYSFVIMTHQSASLNRLKNFALFTLFVSSYLPLFLMLIVRQASTNISFLHWGGFSWNSFVLFLNKFGLSTALLLLIAIGYIGYRVTFYNLEKNAANGNLVWLRDVKNKNSEAIGYIATYIIPFLFQSFDSFYEVFSILFLLYIIYRIYINSNMILINPILSIKYAIFEIEYEVNNKKCNGLAVSTHKNLIEDSQVKLYEIGHKLFYLT